MDKTDYEKKLTMLDIYFLIVVDEIEFSPSSQMKKNYHCLIFEIDYKKIENIFNDAQFLFSRWERSGCRSRCATALATKKHQTPNEIENKNKYVHKDSFL